MGVEGGGGGKKFEGGNHEAAVGGVCVARLLFICLINRYTCNVSNPCNYFKFINTNDPIS